MVQVTVSSLDGCQVKQDLDVMSLVADLHQLILHKLDPGPTQTTETTRLIHVNGRSLDSEKTLQEEAIRDKDELILIKRRLKEPSDNSEKDSTAPEVPEVILAEVMASLPPNDNTGKTGVTEKVSDSNSLNTILLHRIVVTLVDCAEMLQFDRLQSGGGSSSEIMYNEEDVKQIIDLGFTEDQAKTALVANNYRLDSAIEWLLAGQHLSSSSSGGAGRGGEAGNQRPRRRRGVFKPDQEAVKNLVEMGFPEGEVITALEVTRNNQQEACAILLGDRQEPFVSTEMYTPLPRDHGLYKLVMERSEIQKALLTPKFLDAMRDLEDKISSVSDFGDDPDIGPILFQISKAIQKYSSTRAAMNSEG